jgi:transketolase
MLYNKGTYWSILRSTARKVRKRIFEFKTRSGSGHLASCLSTVDILVSLYFDEDTYFNPNEDVVIFSKGHGSPAVYPILVDLGFVSADELEKYCQPDGILRLHADSSIPGCSFVGGSLGNGIGYAAGLAYGSNKNVYVILGDAELYEGSVWESLIFIAHHNINNLHLIVDRNKMGILGATEDLLKLEPLKEKFESFGFETRVIDGHNFKELSSCFKKSDKPVVTIANTVKGKGVSYMEGVWQYHTIIPKDEELINKGLEELS